MTPMLEDRIGPNKATILGTRSDGYNVRGYPREMHPAVPGRPCPAGRARAVGIIGSKAVVRPEARVRALVLGAPDRDTFTSTVTLRTGLA